MKKKKIIKRIYIERPEMEIEYNGIIGYLIASVLCVLNFIRVKRINIMVMSANKKYKHVTKSQIKTIYVVVMPLYILRRMKNAREQAGFGR